MAKYILDDLDHKIISLLFEDARISNRKLASQLVVTEGTIRGRVKRLEDENLIRFTAVTSIENLATPRLAHIGIQVEQSLTQQVIDALNAMPEVNVVIKVFGRFDIFATGLFQSLAEAHQIAGDNIQGLKGVRHVETISVVEIVKYDNRVAKIVPKA